ncbi:ATPase, partial [Streptomyces sp. WI04-05B]|nr:ATPase [Streptomyces sp. WI04-05B]
AARGWGSSLAGTVVAEGGRSLAALVARLAARGVPVDDVVVAGGTVLAQPALHDALLASLSQLVPGARLQPLRVPPVEGAVELARSLV